MVLSGQSHCDNATSTADWMRIENGLNVSAQCPAIIKTFGEDNGRNACDLVSRSYSCYSSLRDRLEWNATSTPPPADETTGTRSTRPTSTKSMSQAVRNITVSMLLGVGMLILVWLGI